VRGFNHVKAMQDSSAVQHQSNSQAQDHHPVVVHGKGRRERLWSGLLLACWVAAGMLGYRRLQWLVLQLPGSASKVVTHHRLQIHLSSLKATQSHA
jgi:hypothetical protein